MRLLFEEYGRMAVAVVVGSMMLSLLFFILSSAIYPSSVKAIEVNVNDIKTIDETIPVSIGEFVVKDAVIKENEKFNYQDKVFATNNKGEDISSYIRLLNTIDTSIEGEKKAKYILRYNGQTMIGEAKVIVETDEVMCQPPTS